MNNIEKIGKTEIVFLVITIIFNNLILNIPSIILHSTGEGSWINAIYITLIAVIFMLFISKFFKPFIGADILDVSEYLGGKYFKYIIALLYIILFVSFSAICLRLFANSLRLLYFDNTSIILLMLLFLIPVAITARLGLKAVSGTNLIIIGSSIVIFFIYFFAHSIYFVWQRLFPPLGYGASATFVNGITNLFAFNIIAYLYFLKPFLKEEKEFKMMSVLAVIICGIYLLLSILALIMTFSFITQINETLSIFIVTRLISFGNFFQRVDALITFIWILILLSFLSFNVYIVCYIIKKTIHVKSQLELSFPITTLIFAVGLAFKDIATVKSVSENFYKIYHLILVFVISFIILLVAYIKKKRSIK